MTAPDRQWTGNARRASLQGNVTATDTSFTFDDLNGWPNADFPFMLESEKILATSRVGNVITCTLANRGYDGTTAADHNSGAIAKHVVTSIEIAAMYALASLAAAKGDIIVAAAENDWTRVPVGTDGQVLTARSSDGEGVAWETIAGVIAASIIDGKGQLIVGTADDTVDNLATGTDGYVLTADAAEALGVKWAAIPAGVTDHGELDGLEDDDHLQYLHVDGDSMNGDLTMGDNAVIGAELRDYSETVTTDAAATGAETLDYSLSNVFDYTLAGNTTFTFTNPPASGKAGTMTVIVRQGATLRTVTWPASVDWNGATLTMFANSVNIFTFLTVNGGTTWYGTVARRETS